MVLDRLRAQAQRRLRALAASRRARRLLLRAALVATVAPVLLQLLVAYVVGSDTRLLPPALLQAQNLLVITAHPDDECLFFAPSVLGVLDRNRSAKGGLLAFSTGNNYGLGDLRIGELRGSCAALGIDAARCVALDHAELQDDPRAWWDEALIARIAREHVAKWDVDAIITFDDGGVSGHINHRAVSAAISNYAARDAGAPPTYVVRTTGLWRKYTLLGDLPLTTLPFAWRLVQALVWPSSTTAAATAAAAAAGDDKALVANTWARYLATRRAFGQHATQYSWDRHLYMVLSRYVWFNDLRRVRWTGGAGGGGGGGVGGARRAWIGWLRRG